MNKFDFLSSTRFWQLFLVGVSVGLNFPFPGNPWVQGLAAAIGIWFGGSVLTRTVDNYATKSSNVSVDKANVVTSNTNDSIPSI